ncbi:hypothetical protein [Dactylosporangium sp. NPDC049140]|uniref:hypothetical protein n=1 Tax=Dactylosporangium sp. NPDC049140 TaxID=3155647 RepID=UPI0033E040B6
MTDEHDRPPVRYVDAERINPFRVLLDLHDHATRRPAAPRPDDVLAELALAAAVVSWWTRWVIGGRPAVDVDEVRAVQRRLAAEVGA